MIRAFVAIRPPDAIIDRLTSLQAGAPGRVSPPENLHLTLAFLGEVPAPLLSDADASLEQISAPRFPVTLDGVDLFGGSKPRLIYADVAAQPALMALQAKVAQTLRDAGVEVEARRYSPHITLARLNGRGADRKKAERFAADRSAFLAGPFEVSDFGLYRSTLHPGGPVYERLRAYPLT